MFNFSKSVSTPDLQNKTKTDVQYKVLSDWLRSIHNQNIQLAKKINFLQKTVESMFPSGEPDVFDNELQDK